jgi:hypothetical protein
MRSVASRSEKIPALIGAQAAAYGGENNSKMNAGIVAEKRPRDRRWSPLKGGGASAQNGMVT